MPDFREATVTDGILKGATLYIDHENPILLEMLDGRYDDYIYEEVANIELSRTVVWDVGAEIGYHSLMLAELVGTGGHVITFEPNPHNIQRIENHRRLNPQLAVRMHIHDVALANADDRALFHFSPDPTLATIGHLAGETFPGDRIAQEVYQNLEKTMVTTRRADSLIADGIPAPSFIKIDVEGAEADVLRGAANLLQRHRPVLAIEIHNITCMFQVQQILCKHRYDVRMIGDATASRAFVWAMPE